MKIALALAIQLIWITSPLLANETANKTLQQIRQHEIFVALHQAYPDPSERNLFIAAQYREMAILMYGILGGDCINISTYTYWASRTIRPIITQEKSLVKFTDRAGITQAGPHISAGNAVIFCSIAPVLFDFFTTFSQDVNASFPAFWKEIEQRYPWLDKERADRSAIDDVTGKHLMYEGFRCYKMAAELSASNTDTVRRHQLILAGSLYMMAFEQRVAQHFLDPAFRVGVFGKNPLRLGANLLSIEIGNHSIPLKEKFESLNFPWKFRIDELMAVEKIVLTKRFKSAGKWQEYDRRMNFFYHMCLSTFSDPSVILMGDQKPL